MNSDILLYRVNYYPVSKLIGISGYKAGEDAEYLFTEKEWDEVCLKVLLAKYGWEAVPISTEQSKQTNLEFKEESSG